MAVIATFATLAFGRVAGRDVCRIGSGGECFGSRFRVELAFLVLRKSPPPRIIAMYMHTVELRQDAPLIQQSDLRQTEAPGHGARIQGNAWAVSA